MENSVKIVISKKVRLTRTYFLISIPNFLNMLGGAVSSGQTLVWVIVTSIGIAKIVKGFRQWCLDNLRFEKKN